MKRRKNKWNAVLISSIIFIVLIAANLTFGLEGPHGDKNLNADIYLGVLGPDFGTCARCHNVHGGNKAKRLWYEDVAQYPGVSLVETLCRTCHSMSNFLKRGVFDDDSTGVHAPGHVYQKTNHIDKDGNTLYGFGKGLPYEEGMYKYPTINDMSDFSNRDSTGSFVSCYVCHDPHGTQFNENHTYINRREASSKYAGNGEDSSYNMRLADNYFVTKVWTKKTDVTNAVFEKKLFINRQNRSGPVTSGNTYREFAYGSTDVGPDISVNIRDLCFNCHRPAKSLAEGKKIWESTATKAEERDDSTILVPPVTFFVNAGMQPYDSSVNFTEFPNKSKMTMDGFGTATYYKETKTCVVGCHNPIIGETVQPENITDFNTAKWYVATGLDSYGNRDTTYDTRKLMSDNESTYVYYTKIACVSCHNQQGKLFNELEYPTHHPYDQNISTKIAPDSTVMQYNSRKLCLACHDEHIKYFAPKPIGAAVRLETEISAHVDDTTIDARKDLCVYCHPWKSPLNPGSSVCGNCHGFPPNYYDKNAADQPGVHETHVIGEGFTCKTCHRLIGVHNGNQLKNPKLFVNINRDFVNVNFDTVIHKTAKEYAKPFKTSLTEDTRYNRRRGIHTFGYKIFADANDSNITFIPDNFGLNESTEIRLTRPLGIWQAVEPNNPVSIAMSGYAKTLICTNCHDNKIKGKIGTKNDPIRVPDGATYAKPLPTVNIKKYYTRSGHGTSHTASGIKPDKSKAAIPNPNAIEGDTRTDCTDCHTPHGSKVFPLIRATIYDPHKNGIPRATGNPNTSTNEICFACHTERFDNGFWPGRAKYEASIHNKYSGTDSSRVFDADTTKSWVADFTKALNPILDLNTDGKYKYENRFKHDSSMTLNGVTGLAAGRCVNCHNPHGDGSANPYSDPDLDTGREYGTTIMDSTYKNMTNYPGAQLCYRCHTSPALDGKMTSRVATRIDMYAPWSDLYTNPTMSNWIDSDIRLQFESTKEPTIYDLSFKGSHHDVGGTRYQRNKGEWLQNQRGVYGSGVKYPNDSTNYDWNGNDNQILNSDIKDDSRIECINCHNPHIVQRDDPTTIDKIETLINPDPDFVAKSTDTTGGLHRNSVVKGSITILSGTFDSFFTGSGTIQNKEQLLNRFCLRCHDHDSDVPSFKDFKSYQQLDPPGWLYNSDTLLMSIDTTYKAKYIHTDGLSHDTTNKVFYGELPRGVTFPKEDNGNLEFWKKWDKSWFFMESGHGKFEGTKSNYDTTVSCMNCHHPHGTNIPKLLRDDTTSPASGMRPVGAPSENPPYPSDGNGAKYCYRCHKYPINNGFWNGQAGWNEDPANIVHFDTLVQYQIGYEQSIHSYTPASFGANYNTSMYNPKRGYKAADAGKCINCHDVHGTVDKDEVNPYYQTMGYPNMTYGYKENLCYNCHNNENVSKWLTPGLDLEGTFAAGTIPYNMRSRHDIDTSWQKGFDGEWDTTLDYNLGSPSRVGPNNDDRRIECISCHNVHVINGKYEAGKTYSPVTNPENPAQIMRDYDTINQWKNGTALNAFCLKCHDSGWNPIDANAAIDTRYKSLSYLVTSKEFLPRPIVFPDSTTIMTNSYPYGDAPQDHTIWWAGNKKRYGRYFNKSEFFYNNGHGSDSTLSIIEPREAMSELCIGCHDPHASKNVKLVRDKATRFKNIANPSYTSYAPATNYNRMDTAYMPPGFSSPVPPGFERDRYCNWACHKVDLKHAFTYIRNPAGYYVDLSGNEKQNNIDPAIDTTYGYLYNVTPSPYSADITRDSTSFTHLSNDYLPSFVPGIGYYKDYPRFGGQNNFSDVGGVDGIKDTYNAADSTYLPLDTTTVNSTIYYRYMCLTCHNPHGTSTSTSKNESFSIPGYVDSTINEGMTLFEPENRDLCLHCHILAK